jgi:hypothetical protein
MRTGASRVLSRDLKRRGLWVDRAFYFSAGLHTRKGCILAENPKVAVHLESADVVILEGVAEVVTDLDPRLVESLRLLGQIRDGFPRRRRLLRRATSCGLRVVGRVTPHFYPMDV